MIYDASIKCLDGDFMNNGPCDKSDDGFKPSQIQSERRKKNLCKFDHSLTHCRLIDLPCFCCTGMFPYINVLYVNILSMFKFVSITIFARAHFPNINKCREPVPIKNKQCARKRQALYSSVLS